MDVNIEGRNVLTQSRSRSGSKGSEGAQEQITHIRTPDGEPHTVTTIDTTSLVFSPRSGRKLSPQEILERQQAIELFKDETNSQLDQMEAEAIPTTKEQEEALEQPYHYSEAEDEDLQGEGEVLPEEEKIWVNIMEGLDTIDEGVEWIQQQLPQNDHGRSNIIIEQVEAPPSGIGGSNNNNDPKGNDTKTFTQPQRPMVMLPVSSNLPMAYEGIKKMVVWLKRRNFKLRIDRFNRLLLKKISQLTTQKIIAYIQLLSSLLKINDEEITQVTNKNFYLKLLKARKLARKEKRKSLSEQNLDRLQETLECRKLWPPLKDLLVRNYKKDTDFDLEAIKQAALPLCYKHIRLDIPPEYTKETQTKIIENIKRILKIEWKLKDDKRLQQVLTFILMRYYKNNQNFSMTYHKIDPEVYFQTLQKLEEEEHLERTNRFQKYSADEIERLVKNDFKKDYDRSEILSISGAGLTFEKKNSNDHNENEMWHICEKMAQKMAPNNSVMQKLLKGKITDMLNQQVCRAIGDYCSASNVCQKNIKTCVEGLIHTQNLFSDKIKFIVKGELRPDNTVIFYIYLQRVNSNLLNCSILSDQNILQGSIVGINPETSFQFANITMVLHPDGNLSMPPEEENFVLFRMEEATLPIE